MDRQGAPTARDSHKKQRRKVVFVDPDDPSAPYWWPAMVVPSDEIAVFKQTMDASVREPERGEHLVCYFEDASFSTVPESALLSFDPTRAPYITYRTGANADAFRKDKAVLLATYYWETGVVPLRFTWIENAEKVDEVQIVTMMAQSARDRAAKERMTREEAKGEAGTGRLKRRESMPEKLPRRDSASARGAAREIAAKEGGTRDRDGVGTGGKERVRDGSKEPGSGTAGTRGSNKDKDVGHPKPRKDSVGSGGKNGLANGGISRKLSISSVSTTSSNQPKVKPSKLKLHLLDATSNNGSASSKTHTNYNSPTTPKHHPSSAAAKINSSTSTSVTTSPSYTTTTLPPSSLLTSPHTSGERHGPKSRLTTPASPTKLPKATAAVTIASSATSTQKTTGLSFTSLASNPSPALTPIRKSSLPALSSAPLATMMTRADCSHCGVHVHQSERIAKMFCKECLAVLMEMKRENGGTVVSIAVTDTNQEQERKREREREQEQERDWGKDDEGWEEPIVWVMEGEDGEGIVEVEGMRGNGKRKREEDGELSVCLSFMSCQLLVT
ncbi:hypothetical protein BC938DRAFT_482581 [Jimgerdemannia flammicorona]|uniref:Uncharacterized protein n=1 Tax=Jimgerdemannia flammicorona TaxID=994334 RepID=A0A433QDS5_9FUNG|nr:hypothetical protein BC938DRAFT_482581 [Jimgerdemannia flammicorona]